MFEWLRRSQAVVRRLWVGAERTDDADPKAERVHAELEGLARDIRDLNHDGRPLDALVHRLRQHQLIDRLRRDS